jgi:hypothetical protein
MSTAVLAPPVTAPARPGRRFDLGRAFVHPAFDLLIIGGGLSVAVLAYFKYGSGAAQRLPVHQHLWTLVLLSNSAHFAGSTVRLYTKKNSFRDLRFLTMGLPLASIAVLALALFFPAGIGSHLQALYLTWSPYHYSAQAYGIAMIYCYRSGRQWSAGSKNWIRLACLLPFLAAFLSTGGGAGIGWLVPPALLAHPVVEAIRSFAVQVVRLASLALPPILLLAHSTGGRPALPVISFLAVMTNAVWFAGVGYVDLSSVALITVFHGVQYLALLTIFHVREQVQRAAAPLPWWRPAGTFYLACLGLGYFLFQVWPHAFVMAGFGYAESVILVIAVINIHHFIVDAYIWRLRKDPNYAVVQSAGAASTAAPAPA